jgi:DNA invertase Pin-like site-specific DNA recombinase
MIYGYARVSTTDQDLSIQHEKLTAAGCTVIRAEKVSGTSTEGREELATLLQFLREGDTLVITRIDRLARSMRDLQNIVHELKQRGVTLKATEQPVDTSTAAGKAFFDMLGVFAEFETNLRKERQMEGIAKAKAEGVYASKGRPKSIKLDMVRALKAAGKGPTEIAEELKISRASVYRALAPQILRARNGVAA